MNVPLLDLNRVHGPLADELKAAFARVLDANSYILGKEVTSFEAACADYLGVKHAIGVSSGSDALLLALMALNIGPGDEVICPSYTFFATAGAVARLGAQPVFVDSDPYSHNWDLSQVFAAANERTKAVIPVHLFGLSADMMGLREWADARKITVIEDVAQSMGATFQGRMTGGLGTFACYSFFPSKNLGGFGDGGLLTCDDDVLAEKARVLRAHGAKPKYHHHFVGGNFRLDALQAALLAVKLPHLESWLKQREQVASRYLDGFKTLEDSIALPPSAKGGTDRHTYNQFVIRLRDGARRDALQQKLSAQGIATAVYYPKPLHLQPCFADCGLIEGALPVCENASRTTLALPIFPGMTAEEQNTVIAAVTSGIRA